MKKFIEKTGLNFQGFVLLFMAACFLIMTINIIGINANLRNVGGNQPINNRHELSRIGSELSSINRNLNSITISSSMISPVNVRVVR